MTAELPPDVADALNAGHIMEAIRLWSEHYDVDVTEAAARIQALERGLGTHEDSLPRNETDPGD